MVLGNVLISFTCKCPVFLHRWLANAGETRDLGSIPGSGSSPRVGNGNPFQYSCLKNSMDRGSWWAMVHGSQRVGYDWAYAHPVQLSQHHLWKRLAFLCFSIVYSCFFCHRLIDQKGGGLFGGSLFCFIDLCVYFCVNTILFWLLKLCGGDGLFSH